MENFFNNQNSNQTDSQNNTNQNNNHKNSQSKNNKSGQNKNNNRNFWFIYKKISDTRRPKTYLRRLFYFFVIVSEIIMYGILFFLSMKIL